MRTRTITSLTAVCLLLTGCGISTSGPHAAGAPASGMRSTSGRPPAVLHLYFYSAAGLQRVSRPSAAPGDPQAAVDLVLRGPTTAERARGLISFLPPGSSPRPLVRKPEAGVVDIQLPPAWHLDATARRQLVCTVADASTTGGNRPQDIRVRLHTMDTDRPTVSTCSP